MDNTETEHSVGFGLILVDPNPDLCAMWEKYFADASGRPLADVHIIHDTFQNLPSFDCMVGAANSFGIMDGGVDAALADFFGYGLQARIQAEIIDKYRGEQPVGTSLIVATDHLRHPFVAHTPTMRVPMPITRTDNVYCAMWAMLLAVLGHNRANLLPKIERVACPGLGTGYGKMPPAEAAYQMSLAWRHFVDPPAYISGLYAHNRQEAIRYGGDSGSLLPPRSR